MPHKMPRQRSTKAESRSFATGLLEIVEAQRPMTVRQTFYQAASVRRLVDKTEAGYAKVQGRLTLMRHSGVLPYGWLTDSTRWQRRPITYDGIQRTGRYGAFLPQVALGKSRLLCRNLAGKGRTRWRDRPHNVGI